MFVFSNLATTLDGKIAPSDGSLFLLGTPEDRRQMQVLRRQSDIILMGASTLRSYQKPCYAYGAGRPENEPANAVLSSNLENISPEWPFFSARKLKRILFVGDRTPSDRIRLFEKSSEIVLMPTRASQTSKSDQILGALSKRGYSHLLVEGGGSLMWEFARQNRIDEYHVTLTPRILGGSTSPTLVDGAGFAPDQSLKLKLVQCRILGDELYLTYRKTEEHGS